MALRKARRTGFIAAVLLAAMVLFVFSVLRDYGPESAIRKFHMAVLKDNPAELQAVTEQPIGWVSVQSLVERVRQADALGAKYYVARMERRPDEVVAVAMYALHDGSHGTAIWDVRKEDGVWKIDANRTLTVFRDNIGL